MEKKQTLYEAFKKSAEKYGDKKAVIVDDLRESYSYNELLELTDLTAAGLNKYGIKADMRIGIMLNGTVEEATVLFACNKLGAVTRWIDFLKDINALMHCIETAKLDVLLMDESFLSIEPMINISQLPVIVVTTKRQYDYGKYVSLNSLINADSETDIKMVPYVEGRVTTIINSSGTTGISKPISLTDYAINAAVVKVLKTDLMNPESVVLKIIPPQIGLGLITTLYTALINGNSVILVRGDTHNLLLLNVIANTKNFRRICGDYNIPKDSKLTVFASPLFIRLIFTAEEISDLSYVESVLAAGSKMSESELNELYEIGKAKGCQIRICNGYGQNELGGAAALNDNSGNEFGSAGRVTHNTIIRVVDRDSLEDCGVNEVGLIIEQSDSMFTEYDGMPEATEEAFLKLPDGSVWFNSHDLGYLSETGYLYIVGRTTRVVIRRDFKLSLDDIEAKIRALPFIKEIGLIITDYSGSEEAITAFIELPDYFEGVRDKEVLIKMLNEGDKLNWNEKVNDVIIVDKLPMMGSGKIDYKKLEAMV